MAALSYVSSIAYERDLSIAAAYSAPVPGLLQLPVP